MKELGATVDIISKAIKTFSTQLSVNDKGTHVKRSTPYKQPINIDERTVYVVRLKNNTLVFS